MSTKYFVFCCTRGVNILSVDQKIFWSWKFKFVTDSNLRKMVHHPMGSKLSAINNTEESEISAVINSGESLLCLTLSSTAYLRSYTIFFVKFSILLKTGFPILVLFTLFSKNVFSMFLLNLKTNLRCRSRMTYTLLNGVKTERCDFPHRPCVESSDQ